MGPRDARRDAMGRRAGQGGVCRRGSPLQRVAGDRSGRGGTVAVASGRCWRSRWRLRSGATNEPRRGDSFAVGATGKTLTVLPTLMERRLTVEFGLGHTWPPREFRECEWRTSDREWVARRCWPAVKSSATPAIQASTTLSEMDDRSAESPISVFDPQETLMA